MKREGGGVRFNAKSDEANAKSDEARMLEALKHATLSQIRPSLVIDYATRGFLRLSTNGCPVARWQPRMRVSSWADSTPRLLTRSRSEARAADAT